MQQTVMPLASPPEELAGVRIQLDKPFNHVTELEVGWLDAEKYPDYALANGSLWYFSVDAELPGTTEQQYNDAWELFRSRGIELLTKTLGLSSW